MLRTSSEPFRLSTRVVTISVTVLLLCSAMLNLASMRHLSVTYDEPNHYRYGEQILQLKATRFLDSTMPISALNVLPARIARALPDGPVSAWLARFETGRYVTVIAALLVGLCVFLWTRELYGPAGGLLALTLFAFDPNFLAHAELITTDVYAAGAVLGGLYAFWRFLRAPGWGRAGVAATVIGLAQLAKYSAVPLYPLCMLIAIGYHAGDVWRSVRDRRGDEVRAYVARFLRWTLLFALVGIAIVNAGFLFERTLTPLREYRFRSTEFQSLQRNLRGIGSVPVPLPYPYVEGFDWILQREQTGEGYGHLYLLGQVRDGRGFPGYYLIASLFKVPLASLAIILAALAGYAWRQRSRFLRDEWVLICPIVFFVISFNFFDRAQIGLRHFLVVFPLLYVLSGSVLRHRPSRARFTAIALASVALIASVASYYPHYLAYFNELVPDRRLAYRILADSNVDWGQHRWYMRQYLQGHPGVLIEPERPTAGTILVGVNVLTGVAYGPERFRWLRDNFRPIDHIAYAVLVYRVTPADLERLQSRAGRTP